MNTNLKALIEATAKDHPHAGPPELAHHIAQNTPSDQIRDFYRDLLVNAVRPVINKQRHKQRPTPTPADATSDQPTPIPITTNQKPKPSTKLDQRRTWWQQMLTSRVQIADGIWKTIGDCTLDDLRQAAKDRDAAIGRLEEQISNFNTLINLLVTHGAYTVNQLPEQQQWKKVPA